MRWLLLALSATLIFGADDPWTKVRELKSGTEVRIYKKNSTQPVVAKMDEATDENLIVVLKDRQVAIPKADIERLDARPESKTGRVVRESKSTTKTDDGREGSAGRPGSHAGVTSSHSSGFTIGSKPDFETVYRRAAAPIHK